MISLFDRLNLYKQTVTNELADDVLIPNTANKILEKAIKSYQPGKKKGKKLQRVVEKGKKDFLEKSAL